MVALVTVSRFNLDLLGAGWDLRGVWLLRQDRSSVLLVLREATSNPGHPSSLVDLLRQQGCWGLPGSVGRGTALKTENSKAATALSTNWLALHSQVASVTLGDVQPTRPVLT